MLMDMVEHEVTEEAATYSPQEPYYDTDTNSSISCTQISRKSEGRMKQIIQWAQPSFTLFHWWTWKPDVQHTTPHTMLPNSFDIKFYLYKALKHI